MRAIALPALLLWLCAGCIATTKPAVSSALPPSSLRTAPGPTALAQVSTFIAAGDLASARNLVEEERARGTSADDLALAEAEIALAEERLGPAEQHLSQAAAAAPDLATVDLLRGRMEEMRGHWAEARDAYALANRKAPGSSSAIVLEARVLLVMGNAAEAAELLSHAAESAPKSLELQRATGEAYLAAADFEKAVVYLERARAIDPPDRATFELSAVALYRLGRHAEVVALLDGHSTQGLPEYLELLFGRSALLAGLGDLSASLLDHCIQTSDKDPELWLDLARARVLAGRYADARSAAEHAISLKPNSTKALLLLGHIHKLSGRSREASTCYARALRLGADPSLVAPLIEALVPAGSDRAAPPGGDESCGEQATKPPASEGHRP